MEPFGARFYHFNKGNRKKTEMEHRWLLKY